MFTSGCGDLPRPFETHDDVPILTHVPREDEITILPIENVSQDQNQHLFEIVKNIFSENEIIAHQISPASLEEVSPSLRLKGQLILDEYADDVKVRFEWHILQPDGQSKFSNSTEAALYPKAQWPERANELIEKMAMEKFQSILDQLKVTQDTLEIAKKASLYFLPITDFQARDMVKEQILRIYMSRRLKLLGASIIPHAEEADYFITGSLTITPKDENEVIDIQWKILDKEKIEIFSIKQSNAMPVGEFYKNWNRHYPALAEAAVQSMLQTLKGLNLMVKPKDDSIKQEADSKS